VKENKTTFFKGLFCIYITFTIKYVKFKIKLSQIYIWTEWNRRWNQERTCSDGCNNNVSSHTEKNKHR